MRCVARYASTRSRTWDFRGNSSVLYQLSYRGFTIGNVPWKHPDFLRVVPVHLLHFVLLAWSHCLIGLLSCVASSLAGLLGGPPYPLCLRPSGPTGNRTPGDLLAKEGLFR